MKNIATDIETTLLLSEVYILGIALEVFCLVFGKASFTCQKPLEIKIDK
jgi:hypothetical protein